VTDSQPEPDGIDSLLREVEAAAVTREAQRRALVMTRNYLGVDENNPELSDDVRDLLDTHPDPDHRQLVLGLLLLVESYISTAALRHKTTPLEVLDEHLRQLEDGPN
jgi:hypothetical protein